MCSPYVRLVLGIHWLHGLSCQFAERHSVIQLYQNGLFRHGNTKRTVNLLMNFSRHQADCVRPHCYPDLDNCVGPFPAQRTHFSL